MFTRAAKKIRLVLAVVCLLVLISGVFLLGSAREQGARSTRSWNISYSKYGHTSAIWLPSPESSERASDSKADNESTGVALSFTERQRRRFPGVFIVGFGKSGTKALYEVLKMHPKLNGPKKEVRFFSIHHSNGLSWYLKILPDPPSEGCVIEKSPDYILTHEAAIRLKQAALSLGVAPSSLKFVVVVRNPIKRAVSEYTEWKYARIASGKDLPALSKMILAPDGSVSSQPFLNTSCYSEHVQKWFHYFHRNQFCIVDGDRFVTNPFEEVTKLEACLGLEPFFKDENFVYKEQRGFYCFRRHSLQNEKCMSQSKGRKHLQLPTEQISKLKDYFNECNRQFYEIADHDFRWEEDNES